MKFKSHYFSCAFILCLLGVVAHIGEGNDEMATPDLQERLDSSRDIKVDRSGVNGLFEIRNEIRDLQRKRAELLAADKEEEAEAVLNQIREKVKYYIFAMMTTSSFLFPRRR